MKSSNNLEKEMGNSEKSKFAQDAKRKRKHRDTINCHKQGENSKKKAKQRKMVLTENKVKKILPEGNFYFK